MVEVEELGFRTRIDMRGWNDGLKEADATLGDFTRRATDQLDRLPGPKLATPDVDLGKMSGSAEESSAEFASLGAQIERIGVTFGSIGGEIRRAMASAVGPIHQFAGRFSAQFDEVGATVEELAIRIDAAMRFPIFERRIARVRELVMKPFRKLPEEVKAAIAPVDKIEPGFTGIIDDAHQAGDQVVSAWFDTGKKIGDYDVLGGTHARPSSKAFQSWLAQIDEFKTDAILKMEAARDAILNRPGNRGKGSRKAYNQRKANAASIANMQANRPDMDLTTKATQSGGWLKRLANDPGWERIKAAARSAGHAIASPFLAGGVLIRNFARDAAIDADRFLAGWLKSSQLKGVFASVGSVGNATFGKLAKVAMPALKIDPRQSEVVRGLGAAAEKASTSFISLGRSVAGALGLFGMTYKAVGFLKDGVVEAANLNETLNKTDAVLGQSAPDIKDYADRMADGFGLVKRQVLDTAAGFGGIFKGIGEMSGPELTKATKDFTSLTGDLSSFANMSFEEAGTALRAALTGNESDKLKQLGVIYNESAMEAYALAHGITKSTEDMTEQEKVMIRMGIIAETTKDAQGDLAKTADSTANMYRNLTGSLVNMGAEIGAAMMPAIDQGLKLAIEGVGLLKDAFLASKETIAGWIDLAAAGFDLVAAAIAHPAEAFEVLKLYGRQSLANLLEYVGTFAENGVRLAGWIGENWLLLIGDAFDATLVSLQNLWKNFLAIGDGITQFLANPMGDFEVKWTPLLDGFQATASKLPEMMKPILTDLSDEIAAAGKPIWEDFAKRREAAHAEKPVMDEAKGDALSGAKDKPEKKKKHKKEDQFAGALEVNSKEAYSAFVSAAYGTARRGSTELEKTTKEQLAANRKGNAILGQIAKAVAGAPPQASFP